MLRVKVVGHIDVSHVKARPIRMMLMQDRDHADIKKTVFMFRCAGDKKKGCPPFTLVRLYEDASWSSYCDFEYHEWYNAVSRFEAIVTELKLDGIFPVMDCITEETMEKIYHEFERNNK